MTMWRGLMLLLVAALALLASCDSGPSKIRYRLTLVVETPEGTKTGSGVIEHIARYNNGVTRGLGTGGGLAVATRGEAVMVDLGGRGLLLCLLTRDLAREGSADELLLPKIFPFDKWGGSQEDYSSYLGRLKSRKPVADAPLDRLPMLARFRNPQVPSTAERVDPSNLAATFGTGVRLVRVTAQITDDPVPKPTIEDRLPWVRNLRGSIAHMLGLKHDRMDALTQMNDGSFRQGKWQ